MATNSKKTSEIRYRRWCLTIWKSERFPDKKSVAEYFTQNKVKFCIVGAEITKANEKPHYQCYVEWENGRSFQAIEKDIKGCGHWTEAKGTAQQNIDYCSKEDTDPLRIGYVNLTNESLSKGDIASNLVDIMLSYDFGMFPRLYELICMYPQFSDYIVKNYHTLEKIYFAIQNDKEHMSRCEIDPPSDIPF